MELKKYIREIPDFPKEGILFKDITPLLAEPVRRHLLKKQLPLQVASLNIITINNRYSPNSSPCQSGNMETSQSTATNHHRMRV